MIISGFQKLTLLDFPDTLAAIIFTQGCLMYCGYCHNPEMIPHKKSNTDPMLETENILQFLKKRKGLLQGVVISGGEPTIHSDLPDFIRSIKEMGFKIKLDTNGVHPEMVEKLLKENLLDYIAMDIKQCPEKYMNLVKFDCINNVTKSINIIKNSGVDYEFRSTILPFCHTQKDIQNMGKMIRGAKKWYLQSFRPLKTLDKTFQSKHPFTQKELCALQKTAQEYATYVGTRT